ncbi:TonB-dependent siderophore receptor [Caulobacter sp. 17J65-9]|uniref:TonB-dependent receptor n=1 Tax=Caulobacter sp. 17J65-9 TaxID=2709382 RepID=UPI0013C72C19|nr:TonB-dependent siderophore receptor [Caulobacter sp. 17J65-9]NEX92304.1 TonB-dependent siderophore receptor [Caulobacter sp. 17J65-9]
MRSSNPSGVKAAAKTAVLRVTLAGAAAALLAPAALAETVDADDEPTTVSSVTVEAQGAERSADPKIGKLLDAPQSITVVPQEVIEARGATTLRDVLRNVPGISMQAGEGGVPNGDNLTIRGFSARTDMFVDGVRDVGGYTRDSFNLESVEVIKGPASAYVGRGSTGGSINQVSKTPTLDRFVAGTVGGGSSAYARATVDANLPLSETAALRLNAMAYSADAPGRDEVYARRWGVAPTIAFGLETATRLSAGWLHLEQDNLPDNGIPWVSNNNVPLAAWRDKPAPVKRSNFYGILGRDHEDVVTDVGTLKIEHDFSEALSLSNTLRYIRTHRDSVSTSPRFPSNGLSADVYAEFKHRDQIDDILINQTLLEADFSTGSLQHDAVAGLELSVEKSKNHFLSDLNQTASLTNLYNPDPHRTYAIAIKDNGINKAQGDGVSLFAFDKVALDEHWELAAGVRWDRYALTYNPYALIPATPPTLPARDVGERTDEMVSWKAGVIYKPVRAGSIYLSYGTSFNPGIDFLNLATATPASPDIAPEKSRSYELGTKWELLDRRLLATAAVFRTEKTNARTPGEPGDPLIVLEGEQRVDGFEIGLSGALTQTVTVFGGYTWMDGQILDSNTPAEVGKTLSNTPENTFNVWATWEPVEKVQLGAGAQYVGERFANNTNTREVPAYWTFDAMAAYDVTDDVSVRLNVYNLADETYFDSLSGGHLVPGAARSAVVSLGFRF